MVFKFKIQQHILIMVFGLLFFGKPNIVFSQEATTSSADSVPTKVHSAAKATIYSALVPGLGQIYNEQYWKVPIIYGGFAAIVYYAQYNHFIYSKYRSAYIARIDDNPNNDKIDPNLDRLSESQLLNKKEIFRKYRDLVVIWVGLAYAIQILDANVYAHLYSYDVSPDLSFKVEPTLLQNIPYDNYTGKQTMLGVKCSITF